MASKICDMCGNLMTDKTGLKSSEMLSTFRVPKKNAAFLLAFVFMVSMNVGPYFSQPSDLATFNQDKSLTAPHHASRGLLWIDDDADTTNTSSIDDDQSNEKLYPMCPVSVNQTESIRLATELQRWIGDIPEYINLTKLASNHNLDLKNINDFLLPDTDQATIKTIYKQVRTVRKYMRKTSEQLLDRLNENDRRSAGAITKERRKSHSAAQKFEISKSDAVRASNENRVQIYQPDYNNAIKYAALFKEIHRQNDTFYVVSFRGDHLLLPALAHNNAFRPKMSLMLPTFGNANDTEGIVTLMQIDCEVVNTSMIRIKESSIPDDLKNRTSVPSHKYSAATNNPITTEPLKVRNSRTKPTTSPSTTGTNTLTEQHGNMTGVQNATNFNDKIRRKSTTFENVVDFENGQNVSTLNKYKPYVLRKKSEKPFKND